MKKINKNKKAKRIISICDQGHYGSTKCSLCHADVEYHYKECPLCGAKFTMTENDSIYLNTGGSDF